MMAVNLAGNIYQEGLRSLGSCSDQALCNNRVAGRRGPLVDTAGREQQMLSMLPFFFFLNFCSHPTSLPASPSLVSLLPIHFVGPHVISY